MDVIPTANTRHLFSGPAFEDDAVGAARTINSARRDTGAIGRPITRQFILAGKAIFTASNPAGDRYTYQVSKVENDPAGQYYRADQPFTYFVAALTGTRQHKRLYLFGHVGCVNGTRQLNAQVALYRGQ